MSVTPICCFCQQGVDDTLKDLELSSGLLKQAARDRTLLECGVHHLSFGYYLVRRADRPPPEVVRNPLRSDLTVPLYAFSDTLTYGLGNSILQFVGGMCHDVTARIHGLQAVVLRLFSI